MLSRFVALSVSLTRKASRLQFGCIDYFTTNCQFDATNTALNPSANGKCSRSLCVFFRSLKEAAARSRHIHVGYAPVRPLRGGEAPSGRLLPRLARLRGAAREPRRLHRSKIACFVALSKVGSAPAASLTWQASPSQGATTNIGFHIRLPFFVRSPGDYSFRVHGDYGSGSFMGVDGAAYTPGDIWGHVNVDVK